METGRVWSLICVGGLSLLALIALILPLDWVAAQGTWHLTRVTTSGPGRRSSDTSLSADGRKIAFVSDADLLGQGIPQSQEEIWLYDVATKTFTRVTTAAGSGDRMSSNPSLDADGKVVAFQSDADFLGQGIPQGQYEIWLYDATALTMTRVTTSGTSRSSHDPNLSGDGKRVAFVSDADFLGQGIPQYQNEVWLYDATTMTVTRVTTGSQGRYSIDPNLRADGKAIAFASDANLLGQGISEGQEEIWLYDTATMTVTRITTGSEGRYSLEPNVSTDGEAIAFRSDADFLGQGILTDEFGIWLYDTATMALTRVTTATGVRFPHKFWPSLSADGKTAAFASDADFLDQSIPNNQAEIWLYDTTTMTVTRITTSGEGRDSYFPSLSADGKTVAFASDADFLGQGIPDNQFEIWLYRQYDYSRYLPVILKWSR
jgi:Tol biopolymer transport system component